MSRRLLLLGSMLFGLGIVSFVSRPVSATAVEFTDEDTVCSTLTSCPNRQTQVCAEVHLNPGGAGVVYTCYQPIIP